MLIELCLKGIDTTKKRYLVTDLLTMCNDNNIDGNKTQSNDIPGWLGKPKGMLQILYERGYINPDLVTNPRSIRYSKMGKKYDIDVNSGSIKEDCQKYSLTHLLTNCKAFVDEKTDLEVLCNEISINSPCSSNILFTPKFHCELAGEVIEYVWGARYC